MREKATPKGLTQKVSLSTGSCGGIGLVSVCTVELRGLNREESYWAYPDGDVTRDTLIEPIFAEDSKGCCEPSFQVLALLVWVVELWRLWELEIERRGCVFADTRLIGLRVHLHVAIGARVCVGLSLGGRGWSHVCDSRVRLLRRWRSRGDWQAQGIRVSQGDAKKVWKVEKKPADEVYLYICL